jgi:hypothetical protein
MAETAAVPLSHPLGRGTAGHFATEQDSAETQSGTMSLKALAAKTLGRDKARDSRRDTGESAVPWPKIPLGRFVPAVPPVPERPGNTEPAQCEGAREGDFEERAAIVQEDSGAPREWAEAFARLDAADPPKDIPPARWEQFIDDAGRFLD